MKYAGCLCPDNIASAIEGAAAELEREDVPQETGLRFRLSLEEVLLFYREKFGETAPFSMDCRKRHGDLNVDLTVEGADADPFSAENPLHDYILDGLNDQPVWSWDGKKNRVRYLFQLTNTPWKNYAFAWKYVGSQKTTLLFAVFQQLLSVIFGVIAPVMSARVIVHYMDSEVQQVIAVAALLLLVQLLKNLFLVGSNRGYNKVYCRTLSLLENDLIRSSLQIKNSCLDEKGSGLFIQRLTVDTTRMATGFNRIADMIAQAVNYIGILLAILVVSPIGFILALALLAAESAMEIWRTRRLCKDDRIYRMANERFSGFVSETVRGARDVKLLNSEDAFCAEAQERIVNANDKRLAMQGRSWALKLARWELSELGSFVFIVLLALAIKYGFQSPATVIIIYNYFTSLDTRAVTLAGEFMEFVKDFNLSVERVCALVNSPEFPKEHFGSVTLNDPQGEITFEHVGFAYPSNDPLIREREILKDMSFTIRAGEMVALVGRSGCGKSTVFNLLCRLYDHQHGRILLDGQDVRTLTKDSIRNNVTVVSQNPYIFNLSIRDNLRLAKSDMTEEEMKSACELACIAEDIEEMPKGYDTVIGEGGVNLSGGQRQRLAIARSILKDYRVILFDEATSALDNVTQAKIQKAIEKIGENRTIVLIAHRLSTVIHADRILYMEDGKILAEGSHEELLKNCEAYRLLYSEEASAQPVSS